MMAITHIPDEKHVLSAEKNGLLPAWVNPDLNRLMVVKKVEGDFRSWAESLVDLPAGSVFARITGVTTAWPPTWSSVQVRTCMSSRGFGRQQAFANTNVGNDQAGPDLHLELNSNLVFINHSCAPTLEWDMERMEVRVDRNRDLKKGDCEYSPFFLSFTR